MAVFDSTATGSMSEIGKIFDSNATGSMSEISAMYDSTATGSMSQVFSSWPLYLGVMQQVNWSFPVSSGGYGGVDGQTRPSGPLSGSTVKQLDNNQSGLGYRYWNYTHAGYALGYNRWSHGLKTGNYYYYSLVGGAESGVTTRLFIPPQDVYTTSTRFALSYAFQWTGATQTFTSYIGINSGNYSSWLNSFDEYDITELVSYVGLARAKQLCDLYCRGKGAWVVTNLYSSDW